MEDVSEESEDQMRQHLVNLRQKKETRERNPWFDELWGKLLPRNPTLTGFKIDSKVENVMNVAVLYSETFKNYRRTICPQLNSSCLHSRFNGINFFNKFILHAKGENYWSFERDIIY